MHRHDTLRIGQQKLCGVFGRDPDRRRRRRPVCRHGKPFDPADRGDRRGGYAVVLPARLHPETLLLLHPAAALCLRHFSGAVLHLFAVRVYRLFLFAAGHPTLFHGVHPCRRRAVSPQTDQKDTLLYITCAAAPAAKIRGAFPVFRAKKRSGHAAPFFSAEAPRSQE